MPGRFEGYLRWALARGSDPGMSNRELSNDLQLLFCNYCFAIVVLQLLFCNCCLQLSFCNCRFAVVVLQLLFGTSCFALVVLQWLL